MAGSKIISKEITRPKHTKDMHQDSKEFLETILDTVQAGIVLIDPDTKIIIDVNKTAIEKIGAPREQIIGKVCHKFICPAEEGKCPITDLGQKVDNSEKELLTADGESIPVLKTVTAVTFNGKEYILDSFIDITERKQAEKALRASENKYKTLLENLPQKIFFKDKDSIYVSCNKNYARDLKIKSDKIAGMTDYDYFPKELADKYRADDSKIIKLGKSEEMEEKYVQDGKEFIVNTVKTPILDENENAVGILGIFWDITRRKKAEEMLRENEEKFRAITNTAQDAIIMIDNNGKVILWNNTSEKMFGFSSDEAMGKDCHKLIAPEAYFESYKKGFAKFKKTGEGYAIGKTLQLTARRKNGGEFPVEISLSTFKIKNTWNAVGIIRDITEQVKAHEIQAEIIARYTTMINTVPAIMYLKDVENRYIVVNEHFCLNVGKTVDQIIGKTDYDLFSKEKAEKIHSEDKRVLKENVEIINKEVYAKNDQGDAQWSSITKLPLKDFQDEIKGVVGLIQDITEYHHNREQLMQSDKLAAIGTLAAGVAHEINNPIGYINSNLNTINKYLKRITKYFDDCKGTNPEENEQIKEIMDDFSDAINESIEGTDRVKKIVVDLKSFSRVDRAEKEFANINEGIESTLNIVWNELKYKCKVEKEYGDLPDLHCIPNQLNQVFMNILLNAGHAITTKSGLIKIKSWADNKNIFVSVKDNGQGIPEENLKKIFEPFFTTKDVGKGTGLGLSLVFDIIKKHKGKIDVKSEVGVGTEFIIILPLEGIDDV